MGPEIIVAENNNKKEPHGIQHTLVIRIFHLSSLSLLDIKTKGKMSIQLVSPREIFDSAEVSRLFAAYAAECSIPLIGPINPQPQIYEALDRCGMFKCFGAYRDTQLIGFATLLITVLPHYGKKTATVESLFIDPGQRAGGMGKDLLDAVEAYAKEVGCVAILYSAPAGGRLERLLSIKGYAKTNTVFCRSL